MHIKKILKTLIVSPSFLSATSNNWIVYEKAALMISNQSAKVQELFDIAKVDQHLISENSTFDKAIKKSVDEIYYVTVFDYNIDEESQYDKLISVVFMIILQGFEYMHIKDWKSLSDDEEMVWSINALLKQNKQIQLSKKEKETIHQRMLHYFKGEYSIKKQIDATNEMVELLEEFVKSRGLHLLWFQNESDSYGMFIVKSEVYKALNGKKLDDSCSFSIPHFTLDMI